MADTLEQKEPERNAPPSAEEGHEREVNGQEPTLDQEAADGAHEQGVNTSEETERATAAEGDEVIEPERTPEQWAALEQDLAAARAEQERLAAMYTRLRADFDNFKRRKESEVVRLKETATADFIIELLPVIDNLERAVDAAGEGEGPLAEGVRLVLRQVHQVLEGAGVQVISSVGQPFDPNVHEAVGQVPRAEGVESGTVVDEVLKGYRMGERVLRASMVRVAE